MVELLSAGPGCLLIGDASDDGEAPAPPYSKSNRFVDKSRCCGRWTPCIAKEAPDPGLVPIINFKEKRIK